MKKVIFKNDWNKILSANMRNCFQITKNIEKMLLGNALVFDWIKRKQINIIILHILNSLTDRIHQPTHLHPLPQYCLLQILQLGRVCMRRTLTGFPLFMLLLIKCTMPLTVCVLVIKFWHFCCTAQARFGWFQEK